MTLVPLFQTFLKKMRWPGRWHCLLVLMLFSGPAWAHGGEMIRLNFLIIAGLHVLGVAVLWCFVRTRHIVVHAAVTILIFMLYIYVHVAWILPWAENRAVSDLSFYIESYFFLLLLPFAITFYRIRSRKQKGWR